jgi:FixJ family two-component response regulator
MDITPNRYVAIVDDDESLCRSLGRLLRTAGFQSVTYASGEAFLADSKRPGFDCLLLDIQMGGISGIELRRRLSAVNERTPVIFITAHDSPEIKAEAIASGCAGYFGKTASGAEIVDLIRRITGAKSAEKPAAHGANHG